MATKGLYFYKLVSPYPEDITKDCKLTVNEIDSNFLNLKNAQIDTVEISEDGKKLIFTRKDGEQFMVDVSKWVCECNITVEYDSKNGILVIKHNDKEYLVDGLVTKDNADKYLARIYTDATLAGAGTSGLPLGIDPTELTGQFRAVKKVIDRTTGAKLPDVDEMEKGARYITYEAFSKYGRLYNGCGFRMIDDILKNSGSEWRIPTKADWDGMLNAVEPCEADRNHDLKDCHKLLGRWAGKALKSASDDWKEPDSQEAAYSCEGQFIDDCGRTRKVGTDMYGFGVLPAGYDVSLYSGLYFGKQALFWTSTHVNDDCTQDRYVKVFDYNTAGVYQEALCPDDFISIRLVKDYDGSNFREMETIAGKDYRTVLMPSQTAEFGYTVWMAYNLDYDTEDSSSRLPNNGEGSALDVDYRYVLNHWDGQAWHKKVMEEGDTVVIEEAWRDKDGRYWFSIEEAKAAGVDECDLTFVSDTEFRVYAVRDYDGKLIRYKLVAVDEKMYERLMEVFSGTITEIRTDIQYISGTVEVLSAKLDTEIERSIAKDEEIESALTEEITRAIAREDEIESALTEETKRAIAREDEIESALTEEVARAIAREDEIESALTEEIYRAKAREDEIESALTEEIARATAREDEIDAKLDEEIERAKAKEEELHGEIHTGPMDYTFNVVGTNTILSNDGEHNINIVFDGNYGTF